MGQQLDFFNTINLDGEHLQEARQESKKQNDHVLEIFQSLPTVKMTPIMVWKIYQARVNKEILLTSIRRSITTLTIAGKLREIENEMKEEIYGKPNHYWKLNT